MSEAKILVVEDETIVAMDIAATLRRLGYHVVDVVSTGSEAIDVANRHRPDLVLMDIRLQGAMDGIEAAGAIHERYDIPIVFLTAHADLGTVERSKDAAPYGYIVKPFDDRDLPRAIELALSRHRDERQVRAVDREALWSSEERFRLLVDAIRDYSIAMVDLSGRVVAWNTGAERITGYRADELIGESILIFYPEEDRDPAAFEREMAQLAELGSLESEAWRLRKDGSRFFAHVVRSAIYDRAGNMTGYAAITRDITERKMLEEQLLQSQKLESLGKLAGGIAHDFNNMLMVIMTRVELLLRQLDTQPQRRYLDDIRSAASKSADLTQQLLAASRRQILQPQVVNINDVVRSTMRLLSSSIGEDVELLTELESNLWNVYADPGKLHQVLMNLTLNARDAMEHGGTLSIETRNFYASPSYAAHHPEVTIGEHVVLIVSDTGVGMTAEVQRRIYDPFYTTKSAGTGLGMAVVRGIVEQTGGHIWLYSEVGRGTTFKIFIPRHGRPAGDSPEMIAPEIDPGHGTILLVEDEKLVRVIVEETLVGHGYHVLAASSPREALQLSGNYVGPIDLLLTDVIMPGMNGRELADQLTRERPDMKVIYMSGYTDNVIVHQGVLDRGVLFLEKPAQPDELLQLVRTALTE